MNTRIPKPAAVLLSLLFAGGAGAIAAEATIAEPGEHRPEHATLIIPDAASAHIAGEARSRSGHERALRVFRTTDGQTCLQVGERQGDAVGRRGPDGFVGQPLDSGVCGDGRPFIATTREVLEPVKRQDSDAVTSVYGMLPAGATEATVITSAGEERIEVSEDSTFLLTFDGRIAGTEPRLKWRQADGTQASVGGERRVTAAGVPVTTGA